MFPVIHVAGAPRSCCAIIELFFCARRATLLDDRPISRFPKRRDITCLVDLGLTSEDHYVHEGRRGVRLERMYPPDGSLTGAEISTHDTQGLTSLAEDMAREHRLTASPAGVGPATLSAGGQSATYRATGADEYHVIRASQRDA